MSSILQTKAWPVRSSFTAAMPQGRPLCGRLTGRVLLVLALGYSLGACEWVDSTGVQPNEGIQLEEGLVVPLQELEPRTLDPSSAITLEDDYTLRWEESPLQEGNLPGCASVEGFNPAFAQNSVNEACTSEDDCEIYFEPDQVTDENGTHTVFLLQPPSLRAPVGVTYQLVAQDKNGLETQANFTFCLVAENEKPVAGDDVYSVLEQTTLTVTLADSHLLQNDQDDIDLSNEPLRIVLPVLTPPQLAEDFELFADGTFTYTPDQSILLAPGGLRTDVFEYEVTDGPNTVQANVLVNIVPEDAPPVLLEPIPDAEAVVGIQHSVVLAEYFSDPEGGELAYTIDTTALPPSGNFVLSDTGVLTGVATVQDIGVWQISVAASDVASKSVESIFNLIVVGNLAPISKIIPAQSIDFGDPFNFNISAFFADPELVPLVYTLAGVANENIEIDRFSGIIDGFFSRLGNYALSVSASDGVNPPVARSFVVTVAAPPNSAPVYTGTIANQIVTVGTAMTPIQGIFTDPDADVLSFEVVGILPTGVTLNPINGVISGRPLVVGAFTGLRIFATDTSGATVGSDTFSITVRAPAINQAPTYTGDLSNQTIPLGSAVKPTEGVFFDPDGDALTFSVIGVLPLGLVLSQDGAITGRPRRIGTSANLRIRATDAGGLFAQSDLFRYVITAPVSGVNRAPEYFGSILDQKFVTGTAITPISGRFSDPDRDVLRYSINGFLPTGLTLNAKTGVLSGTPTEIGVFLGVRIVATDEAGLLVRSDRFQLTVSAP